MPHRLPVQLERRAPLLPGALQVHHGRSGLARVIVHTVGAVVRMGGYGRYLAAAGIRYARMSPGRLLVVGGHVEVTAGHGAGVHVVGVVVLGGVVVVAVLLLLLLLLLVGCKDVLVVLVLETTGTQVANTEQNGMEVKVCHFLKEHRNCVESGTITR